MRLACRSALSAYTLLILVAATSPAVYAHPGHAHELVPAASPWHYWLQPEHAIINGMLAAIIAGVSLVVYLRWQAARRAQRMSPLPVARRSQQ